MIRRFAIVLLGLALAGNAFAEEDAATSRFSIGGDVAISRATEGSVIAIGGDVSVNAPVNGSVRAAGGTVTLGADSAISGDVSIAAGTIVVEGPILGDFHAAAGNVRLDGQVVGNASIAAGTLVLGPHARIEGHLAFYGDEMRRDPGAQVLGGMARSRSRPHHEFAPTLAERFAHGWVWTAALLALAALIAAALPEASQRLALELRERPWLTALLGLVALTSIPIAALLVTITIIGIPIAILALVAYAALLLIGYVWLAVVVGGMLLDRVSPETAARAAYRIGAAMLAMLALAILVRVPVLGGLVRFIALVVGIGMIMGAAARRRPPKGI